MNNDDRRGLKICTIGMLIAFFGGALAFLDPATGDGNSGGLLFKLGYAIAVLGILVGIFGTIVHVVRDK